MASTELVEPSKDNIVTKSNVLIEANYKLGVVEQKIILVLASNIQPSDDDFKTYTLPIKDFHRMLGLKGSPKYTEMQKITSGLMRKVFEIHIENKIVQVAWLSSVTYNKDEGSIDIRFDPFLKPYLLELKREFTSYKLDNVIRLKSSYSIRIYELLKQYERLQKRIFSLTDLRKAIGAEDVYPAYGNFKQRVLLPAQKELAANTDITFEFEEIKKGRRVDKVEFYITSKNAKPNEQLQLFEEQPDGFRMQHFQKAKETALKIGFKLTEEQYRMWESYGHERVQQVLNEVVGNKKIKNPIGYITHILRATGHSEVAATASPDQDDILMQLLPQFATTREKLPDWYVEQYSIEHLQNTFQLSEEEANKTFIEIKDTLFEQLGIREEAPKPANEQRLNHLLEIQKKYKNKEKIKNR